MSLPCLERIPKSNVSRILGIVFLLVYTLQNYIPHIEDLPRIGAILLLGFIFISCLLLFKDELLRDGRVFFRHFFSYLRFILPKLALFFLIYLAIGMVLYGIVKNGSANQNALLDFPLWALAIGAVIYAPLLEEIIYRGFLRRVLSGDKVFILLSGLIFGIIHMLQPGQELLQYLYIIQYAALGSFFAWLYVKTNNIFASIFAHFMMNGIAVAVASASLL